jgi:hypothetical protein
MGRVLGRGWAGVPRTVQLIVGAEVLVLGYGGIVHVVQLVAEDLHPYGWAPTWLAAYFTSLTVLDPLAAALLWARRAAGLYLGAAVLITDAVANGYASYGMPGGPTSARVSQAIISLVAIAALAVATRVRRWLRPQWPDPPPPAQGRPM